MFRRKAFLHWYTGEGKHNSDLTRIWNTGLTRTLYFGQKVLFYLSNAKGIFAYCLNILGSVMSDYNETADSIIRDQ